MKREVIKVDGDAVVRCEGCLEFVEVHTVNDHTGCCPECDEALKEQTPIPVDEQELLLEWELNDLPNEYKVSIFDEE